MIRIIKELGYLLFGYKRIYHYKSRSRQAISRYKAIEELNKIY